MSAAVSSPGRSAGARGAVRRWLRWRMAAGAAAVGFGAVLVSLDLWGWEMQWEYGRLIGYDGCLCEQCRDYYLGSFWYEKYGCSGPRHGGLKAGELFGGAGIALLAGPPVWGLAGRAIHRKGPQGRCTWCGYDMSGLPTLKCPECGRSPGG